MITKIGIFVILAIIGLLYEIKLFKNIGNSGNGI
jgi:hypothetical protein